MKTKEQLDADTLFAFQMALKGYREFEYFNETSWVQTSYVSSRLPHRIYHDIPEGWTRHDGEDWKGDKDAVIEAVMFCDGRITKGENNITYWRDDYANSFTRDNHALRIYAYKLSEKKPEIPEGFIPWSGGKCPVAPEQLIEVILRDKVRGKVSAHGVTWMHKNRSFDIIAYRVVEKKVISWTLETLPSPLPELVHKETGEICKITLAKSDRVYMSGSGWHRYEAILRHYLNRKDNSPCGTEVEQ